MQLWPLHCSPTATGSPRIWCHDLWRRGCRQIDYPQGRGWNVALCEEILVFSEVIFISYSYIIIYHNISSYIIIYHIYIYNYIYYIQGWNVALCEEILVFSEIIFIYHHISSYIIYIYNYIYYIHTYNNNNIMY